ncbi:hypothetical protein ACIHJG_39355 [Streptomyces sp. NPDC052415]|uniref:hypothetical protein n=1 Tax=Streptomyces sp. NPDC052415 TaxID=3365690 RepID=UPI0037D45097
MHAPPIAYPADQIPDATGVTAFNRAFGETRDAGAVFVCVARSGQRWTVKIDTSTAAPGHTSAPAVAAVSEAIDRLRDRREARSAPGPADPGHTVLYDIVGEERAGQIAAALHTALHGDLTLLARAVPAA